MKRFWMSWFVSDEDYRPLTYPPNEAIRGWWCTGETDSGAHTICGVVDAPDQDQAWAAVEQDWPGIEHRFDGECSRWPPSDRFPLADWVRGRQEIRK